MSADPVVLWQRMKSFVLYGKRMMRIRKFLAPRLWSLLIACAMATMPAFCQESATSSQSEKESIDEGTVVSSSRRTLVIRGNDDQYHLFTFDRYTTKPSSLAAGSRVRVESRPSEESGARLANSVTVLEGSAQTQGTAAPQKAAPLPEPLRELESDIKKQARRWRLGVQAGAALDPELFLFGVHSQMGPIFSRRVLFRPNAEFAFGELTDLIALNLETVYRLPVTLRRSTWSPYVGAGPALTFIHQNLERQVGGRDIDFGNFDFDAGFNILTGIQSRRGTFFEIKTSLWARPAPTLRLVVGYTF
jgi:hypothetical protein